MPASKQWDVLGVGCNSVDRVYRLPASPKPDSPTAKLRISSHAIMCGGQMATAMAACAGLGLKTAYFGCVGHDHDGRLIRSELEQRGVDVSHVLTRNCPNRFAVIPVDKESGERFVFWDRDERLNLSADEIRPDVIAAAKVLHVDDEDEDAAIHAARLGRAAGLPVTSDIDRLAPHTAELVAAVTVPMFNEHTLPEFTGEADFERALRKLRRSHEGMLCVTLGDRGSMLLAGDELIYEPGFEVEAVDTTAAGDVFRAAFIYSILKDSSPRQILRYANAAAAISCTRAGAMTSVPSKQDVEDALSGAS